jgi:hypothetical protein
MKYLVELINLFEGLKKGVQKYITLWKDQSFTVESIQTEIDSLKAIDDAIADLETDISKKKKEARALENEKQAIADKIVKIANGFHADKPEQLLDYGLKPRKAPEAKPRPTKQLTVTLEDDSDGQGFVIYTQADSDANNYEWEKGQGANPADIKTIPEMKFFKYTSKTTFVDDDVAKGVRYFYRVRAVNTAGEGPWSEAVSRVQ